MKRIVLILTKCLFCLCLTIIIFSSILSHSSFAALYDEVTIETPSGKVTLRTYFETSHSNIDITDRFLDFDMTDLAKIEAEADFVLSKERAAELAWKAWLVEPLDSHLVGENMYFSQPWEGSDYWPIPDTYRDDQSIQDLIIDSNARAEAYFEVLYTAIIKRDYLYRFGGDWHGSEIEKMMEKGLRNLYPNMSDKNIGEIFETLLSDIKEDTLPDFSGDKLGMGSHLLTISSMIVPQVSDLSMVSGIINGFSALRGIANNEKRKAAYESFYSIWYQSVLSRQVVQFFDENILPHVSDPALNDAIDNLRFFYRGDTLLEQMHAWNTNLDLTVDTAMMLTGVAQAVAGATKLHAVALGKTALSTTLTTMGAYLGVAGAVIYGTYQIVDAIGCAYNMTSDDLYFRQVCAARLSWLCRTRNTVWTNAEGHYESSKIAEMIEASIIYEDLFASVAVLHDDNDFKDIMSQWCADFIVPEAPIDEYFEWAWGPDEKSGKLNDYAQTIFVTFAQEYWGTVLTQFVEVLPLPNRPPEGAIVAPGDMSSFLRGDTVTFTAIAIDPEGQACSYNWQLLGMTFSGQTVEIPFPYSGEYTVYMTAKDQEGFQDPTPDSITVNVQPLDSDGHDLAVSGFNISSGNPNPGDSISVYYTITNQGEHFETPTVNISLTSLDDTSTPLATTIHAELQPGSSVSKGKSCKIPSHLRAGKYKLTVAISGTNGDENLSNNYNGTMIQVAGKPLLYKGYRVKPENEVFNLYWDPGLDLRTYAYFITTIGGYGWNTTEGYTFAAGPQSERDFGDIIIKKDGQVETWMGSEAMESGNLYLFDSGNGLVSFQTRVLENHAWLYVGLGLPGVTVSPDNPTILEGETVKYNVSVGARCDDLNRLREWRVNKSPVAGSEINSLSIRDENDTSNGMEIDIRGEIPGTHPFVFDMDGANGSTYWVFGRITVLPDADRDGCTDAEDAFPNDPAASVDTDGDGHPDYWNPGKGSGDSTTGLTLDMFYDDSSEWVDSDGDNVGDNADRFPNDVAASVDDDGDGFPDLWNIGKTVSDSTTGLKLDRFPNNRNEWADTDLDGFGDNSDWAPEDPYEWADSDGDGVGDNADVAPDDSGRWDNTNPEIAVIPPASLKIGETSHIDVTVSDADNDEVSLSLLIGPDFISINGFILSISPSDSFDAGQYNVILQAEDEYGGKANCSFDLNISGDQCVISIYPFAASFDSEGGAGSVEVTTTNSCTWSASENLSWITITSGSNCSGSGVVQYFVEPNNGASQRRGTISISEKTLTINQAGTLGDNQPVKHMPWMLLLLGDDNEDDLMGYSDFAITASKIAFGSDYNQACIDEFGSGWGIADWNDLKNYYLNGGDLLELVQKIGFDTSKNAWIKRNGQQSYSSSRDYFASYHNHDKPSHYMSHDDIDNYFFSLGSWDSTYHVICHCGK